MTNTQEIGGQQHDPEGSIFLQRTQREIDNDQFALLLGRGRAANMSPEEQIAAYEANKQALEAMRLKIAPEMATVAFSPEI